MLSIDNPKRGGGAAGYYFQYYERDAPEEAFWFGRGADLLGLPTVVKREHFDNLLKGFSPDGKHALVQNAGHEDRRGFWDLTLSAPKSLSALYATSPAMRKEIKMACEAAVRSTLMEVEDSLGMSRQGKDGKIISLGALSTAVFFHETNRNQEPQIHFHCVLINTAVRPDGTTGAVFSKPIYEEKNNIGQLFREKLAEELRQRFGLEIKKEKHAFSIEGISKELCEAFSSRSKDVRAYMAEHGLEDAVGAKIAAIKTRGPKKHLDRETLDRKWNEVAMRHGATPERTQLIWNRGQERLKERALSPKRPENLEPSRQNQPQDVPMLLKGAQNTLEPKQGAKPSVSSRAEERKRLKAIRAFERELRETRDKIFVEKQTRAHLTKVGFALARKHEVHGSLVKGAVEKLKLPVQRRFFRIEWTPLFSKAPGWSPAKGLRAPKIVLWNKPRRWGRVTSRKPIPSLGSKKVSLAVQRRSMFPRSPIPALRNLTLPALRVRRERSTSHPSLPEQRKRKLKH